MDASWQTLSNRMPKFMKDLLVSFAMTNIRPFNVRSIEGDLFLFTRTQSANSC